MADTSLNQFHASGTTAERTAFTPTPPTPGSGNDYGYTWWDTDNQLLYAWDVGLADWVDTSSGTVATPNNAVAAGRLTTETTVPISTSDRTAQSTIYFTPIGGNRISLYTGSAWSVTAFSELSLALSGLTSGKNYDVFVDYNSGTPQLVLSAAWTTDTARADAVALQDGVVVKSGTPTYRHVGTIRTTSTTTTEDSLANRFVWNRYNQVLRSMRVYEATNSWTYNTATIRQANGSASNQLSYVTGDASIPVSANISVVTTQSAADVSIGVGVDSTTTYSGITGYTAANAAGINITASYTGQPGLGYHFLAWLERGGGSGTQTWYGDNGGTIIQSGIIGTILG